MGRLLLLAIAAIVVTSGLAVVAAVVLGLLIFIGGPGAVEFCDDRAVLVDSSQADTFQRKWDAFNDTLDGGEPASVVFDESEVSSRAVAFLEEKDAPLEDVLICLFKDEGEASGKVTIPGIDGVPVLGAIFGDLNFRIAGTVDLSGDSPEVVISNIDVGSVPGPIADRFEGLIRGIANDQLDDLEIEHRYRLGIGDGVALIGGEP
jgi:hypothetical protein